MKLRISDKTFGGSKFPERIERELLAEDMERFHSKLEEALQSRQEYLTEQEFEIYRRGKKLRPMLLLLCARAYLDDSESLSEQIITGAVALEMIHVASLIHDDIIDGAASRRGVSAVHKTRGVPAAILIGDMEFLSAIRMTADLSYIQNDTLLVRMLLDSALKVCYGELDELNSGFSRDTDEMKERYLKTIERKTASLFQLACEAGIILAGGHRKAADRVGLYGKKAGMCFQIMDDLFDLMQTQQKSGKGEGMDLKNGCLTLPIIYSLKEFPQDSEFVQMFQKEKALTDKEAIAVRNVLRQKNGLWKAYEDACTYAAEAKKYLVGILPDNRWRKALDELADYIVYRE